ncbi:MAG: DNA polymerase III subunit delta [Tannerellaceae bacterium]|jgi:DNA polymerase-3 subunit delta'|nr:DNA polymerase III subunit delta [Tannerellaceae bacterium]
MYFKDVFAQEPLKERLRAYADKRNFPHALLLSEAAPHGAFPLALAFARYLNCLHPTPSDACGSCPACKKFDNLAHPDLLFVFPIAKRSNASLCNDFLPTWRSFIAQSPYFDFDAWRLTLDAANAHLHIFAAEANHLLRALALKPAEARTRTVILWLPEKLQPEAANKLLKLIEEPPLNTLFLLISLNPDDILPTIASRSQRIHLPPIPIPPTAPELASALDLQHQRFFDLFQSLMRNAYTRNLKNLKDWTDSLAASGREEQKHFLRYTQFMLRENFVFPLQLPSLSYLNEPETTFTRNFAPFISHRNVSTLMDAFARAESDIDRNVNSRFVFFDLALKAIPLLLHPPPSASRH